MKMILVILGLSCFGLKAQVNTDSLWGIWNNTNSSDSIRLVAIEQLGRQGFLYSNPDSAFKCASLQIKLANKIDHPLALSNAYHIQGIASRYLSDNRAAINFLKQSLILKEELNDSLGIMAVLNDMAKSYKNLDEYGLAEQFGKQSLGLRKKIADQKGTGECLHDLAYNFQAQGMYDSALVYYQRSIAIKTTIDDVKGLSFSYGNLGIVHYELGDFTKAIDFYNRSLELKTKRGDMRGSANTLNNLGIIYFDQGDMDKATEYYHKSAKIREQQGDLSGFSASLLNLGSVYKKQGDNAQAIEYYNSCLEIKKEINSRRGMAMAHNNIGLIYILENQHDNALEHQQKSLALYNEIGSKKGISSALNNIGRTLAKNGNFSVALESSRESNKIAKAAGVMAEIRLSTISIVEFLCAMDSLEKAKPYAQELVQLRLQDLEMNFPVLTERKKELYFGTMSKEFDLYHDFSLRIGKENPEFHNQTYNNNLIIKSLLLKSSTHMRLTILNSKNSALISSYEDWIILKRKIAKGFASGKNIDSLEIAAAKLESILVSKSTEFSTIQSVQKLNWTKIRENLKDGESAIEFVRFNSAHDFEYSSEKRPIYAALVINNKSDHVEMIKLFEETELEKTISSFPGNNLSYIEQVYGTKENTKSQLYDLIWKPLEPHLAGIKKVYVSPVGLLHKISFAALAKDQDVYLCDNYDIEMMSSTGNLAVRSSSGAEMNENAHYTLFGGIDYNSDSTTSELWSYLDGSLSETERIEKTLSKAKRNVTYYNLSQATEEQFKKTASESNVLHIATHGFFYADPDEVLEASVDKEESKKDLVFRGGTSGMGVNTFVKSRNPLMRSGLVFAGANDVWNRTSIEGEDGVLTAAEVATIDMRNTELVVLSACETGLGDIKGSEGVYGLQRSFKMAGVKYLIMSLWQVPDKETAEFMTTFYEKLTENNDIKKAFKETQLEMRKKYDPYYWGAFVLIE